ncbi:hypothetical protein JRO89_XS05G0008800 [Xanthoceras sorbifolium]|uniref:DOG1 domain-containing protein n=1 Tax=Xanthoceras sorbifolium TaxID=99658 RepID=A0ABQ8HZX2_9ROSI|nr:hypothetical protein JRO89_XS05G0008800 [Xanthoceras sorbifolium]
MFSLKSNNVTFVSNNLHYNTLSSSIGIGCATEIVETTGPVGCLDTGQFISHKGTTIGSSLGNGHIENWGESVMADNSQQTDTSTDIDTDDKNQTHGVQHGTLVVVDSMDQSKAKAGDQKVLRRLAQNREAARKSRLRKKVMLPLLAYVQQLENSRLRLSQLEQELQRARQQGIFITTGLSGDHGHSATGNGKDFIILLQALHHVSNGKKDIHSYELSVLTATFVDLCFKCGIYDLDGYVKMFRLNTYCIKDILHKGRVLHRTGLNLARSEQHKFAAEINDVGFIRRWLMSDRICKYRRKDVGEPMDINLDNIGSSWALAFDMDYARWLDEHQRLISDLRSAVNSHMGDNELRLLVDGVMAHYDELFQLKSIGTKADVFHMLSGMWKTPAERCFMWLGGFRSSELLKILGNHLEPLTDQQLMGICNLQQSSQQAEDALSQGMEALQQSLVDTLSSASLGPSGTGNVADYMGQMAIAMGKLATLENFLHQADLLRQQTLQQMHRILTTRQAARALLVINDYTSRLRALSSLWLARPRE